MGLQAHASWSSSALPGPEPGASRLSDNLLECTALGHLQPLESLPVPSPALSPTPHPLTQRGTVFLLALLCCVLWGSSYPAIKSGYALLGIAGDDIPSKLVFAGWRFFLAGVALLAYAAAADKPLAGWPARVWGQLAVLGLVQTALQYVFFYIGVAHTTGVKGSIMNATGTFFSVLLAHFIYHNDRLSYRKALG
ncbi:MAG: EamA family transporter, partial [Comamonadaceae bacterium]